MIPLSFAEDVRRLLDEKETDQDVVLNRRKDTLIRDMCNNIEVLYADVDAERCGVVLDPPNGRLVFQIECFNLITEYGTKSIFYTLVKQADAFRFINVGHDDLIRIDLYVENVWVYSDE